MIIKKKKKGFLKKEQKINYKQTDCNGTLKI